MRFATFDPAAGIRGWGVAVPGDESRLVDLSAQADPALPPSLDALIALEPGRRAEAMEAIRGRVNGGDHRIDAATVRFRAPVRPVRNVFAMGANYSGHVEESAHSVAAPEQPIVFTKATTTVTGPGDIHVDPALTSRLDWEVELALVLGVGGRHIAEAEVADHVFGYLTANDLSARDQQHGRPEGQWFLGKSLDELCPIGPWLVSRDEIGDASELPITLSVNGVLKQRASTAELIFGIPRIVSELSRFITMLPGDIILTGTPAGVGDARDPQEYLADGDVVEAQVAGLGVLRNRIVFVPGTRA